MGSVARVTVVACLLIGLVGCSFPPSFSEDEKRALQGTASEYQQSVLEDLVVTETEYRAAVDIRRTCVQEKGWGVGPVTQDGDQLGFTASYSGDDGPSSEEMRACYVEYLEPTAPIWLSQRDSLSG